VWGNEVDGVWKFPSTQGWQHGNSYIIDKGFIWDKITQLSLHNTKKVATALLGISTL
jgi:hypothetical protein